MLEELQLISLKENLIIDKNLYAKNPRFGMDIYAKDFILEKCVILENNGLDKRGIPYLIKL